MRLKLTERKPEVPGIESFIFEPQEPLQWKAGQFLHYVLHHEPTDDRGSDRWFTVASAPQEKHVMVTTRFANDKSSSFKSALFALNVGEQIEISDIDGDFTIEDTDAEYVFIAGGIGVTPFRSILTECDLSGVKLKATLLYANRDKSIPYKAELDRLAGRNDRLHIEYLSGRLDDAKIREFVPDLQRPIFYVSGPELMVNSFNETLKQMGVPEAHIKGDWFPNYPDEFTHA